MSDTETEINYHVIYQEAGSADWMLFSRGHKHYQNRGPLDSTTSLVEAIDTAQGLITGTVHTDSRPEFRKRITAARVMQQVHVGTTLVTFGTPQRED